MQTAQHTKDMKKTSVFKSFKRFKDEGSNISDNARSGRPSVITPTLVASVKTFIEEDRRRTIIDVVDGTGIALGTVWNIHRKHLHMKRICARLVPSLTFALFAVVRRRRDVDWDVVDVTPGCFGSSLLYLLFLI